MMKKFVAVMLSTFLALTSAINPISAEMQTKAKVDALLANMSIEAKVGQMIQADTRSITPEEVVQYGIGSILSGGGASPSSGNEMTDWAKRANEYHVAIANANGIPLLYGVDAVHGNNNVYGATIYPHNIGLSAANDTSIVKKIGEAVGSETIATGANWAFTPTVGVPHNERWGRTYETFGDDYKRVSSLSSAYISGLQNGGLVATAKHFLGEGLTENGTNQGNAIISEKDYKALIAYDMSNDLVKELLTPYKNAIDNGVQSIMISYNSINGVKCHGNKDVMTTLLKEKMGFKGILISDYNGVDQISASRYEDKVAISVNAGMDMIMVDSTLDGSPRWLATYNALLNGVKDGTIAESRINDAVSRILTVKYDLGIMDNYEKTYANVEQQALFGSDEHRKIAREAVAKSLTLLKNTQMGSSTAMEALDDMSKVVVSGSNAHNIGNQCGGWTISWQGSSGDITEGTTIYEGIKANLQAKGGNAYYAANGYFEQDVEAAIVVVGESPYAESDGDASTSELKLTTADLKVIQTIEEEHPDLPIYLVLVTGRPLTIADQVMDDHINAIISAWLPGSEGAGVADVLFSTTADFTGTNPITWPWYAKDIDTKLTDKSKVLYEVGYGLKKSEVSVVTEKPADPDVIIFDETGTTRIEAENAYEMSSGITLENNGTTVGYLENGRYLSYKISTTKDSAYTLDINVNAQDDQKKVFQLYVDDKLILDNIMDVKGVGNWTTFNKQTIGTVSIPKGEHILKLVAKAKDFNLDWYEFTVSDEEYVAPIEPEKPGENIGSGAIIEEDAVKVTMSSSENSGDRSWYYGNYKIENKNTPKDSLDLRAADDSTMTTINVDDSTEYNTFLGMGTSIDESTVYNLWKMDEADRYAFIKRLVDPVNGAGNTLFRLTIGTADFTAQDFYTYYDGNGKELNGKPDWYNETGHGFSIQKDIDYHIIETIKLVQKAAKECGVEDQLKFFASPWTPPGWMKEETSNSKSYKNNTLLLKGGKLSDQYINEAGKYYARFIEEYAKQGIDIYAMTLQNEPMLEIDYPSCLLSATQAAKLSSAIKKEIAASTVLNEKQKELKIWAFDHNPGDLNTYMNSAYNADSENAIDGAAVHDYGGELSNMTTLHNKYNDKTIHLTERSVWGTTGMDRIVQYFRNYAESYNCWVTMLDSEIKTHQWVGTPDPTAFVQDAENPNNYWATPEVYLMGQFSKYVRPGFVRVHSNYGSSSTVTNVVFKDTENNQLIMIAVNNTNTDQNFKVVNNGVQFNATLPAKNCATYIWDIQEIQAATIPGTLTPADSSAVVGMDKGDHFENVTANASATYLVDVKEAGYYNVTLNHAIGSSGWPWSSNDNTEDKTVVLKDEKGQVLGSFNTKRFDTWNKDYAEWGTYFDAQMQVYLEAGVQNLQLLTYQGNINLGQLVFTKARDNIVPGYINATDYIVGKNILIENERGNIGFVETDDYFEYRIQVQKDGTYDLKMIYGCANDSGTNFNIYLDDSSTPLVSNVVLPSTSSWSTYKEGMVNGLVLPKGEHRLRFVVNENGAFNFKGFSIGSYIETSTATDLIEGHLTDKIVQVQLNDGQFIDTLDPTKWQLEGLVGNVDYTLVRISDKQVNIRFTSEISQDFDTDLNVLLKIHASQIGDEGYVLSDVIHISAINDVESLVDVNISFKDSSFKLILNGGTYKDGISLDDIILSDSLNSYVQIQKIEVVDGQLVVTLLRKKTNYVDIAGTITLKTTGYSDGNSDLEANVMLYASTDKPDAIEVGKDIIAKLDHSYDNKGTIANSTIGDYESYYLNVKEAGDYILEFETTNNLGGDMEGALSINGGLGYKTDNLASLALGRYYNNKGISYRTMIHFGEAGEYTLQLRTNAAMKITNITLTMKPDPLTVNNQITITPNKLVDGSDDAFWAIENGNAIGYTSTSSYQDYYVDVLTSGDYKFSIQYATTGTDSIVELISIIDGVETSLGMIDLKTTGSWSTFTHSNEIIVHLEKGTQILRAVVNRGGFNTKSLQLTKVEYADYSKVDEAIASIPEDLSIYTDETVKALNDAINAVIRDKEASEQTLVNQYAKDIEDAINALELKQADYSKVEEAKAKVPSDLSKYTDESIEALEEALKAVVEGLDITKQEEVDAYASAIEEAISNLEEKEVEIIPDNPDQDDQQKPTVDNNQKPNDQIKTGDYQPIIEFGLLGLISLVAFFYLNKKRIVK